MSLNNDDYLREIQQLALADLLLGFDVALGFMLLHLPLLAGISVLISLIYLGQIVELYLKSEARTNDMIIK